MKNTVVLRVGRGGGVCVMEFLVSVVIYGKSVGWGLWSGRRRRRSVVFRAWG